MPTPNSTLSHSGEASSHRGRRAQNLGPVLGTHLLKVLLPLLMTAGPGPRLPLPPPPSNMHLIVRFLLALSWVSVSSIYTPSSEEAPLSMPPSPSGLLGPQLVPALASIYSWSCWQVVVSL